jgi:hypothetical protein
MMQKTAFPIVFAFAAGFLTGISIPPAEAKRGESDAKKWERLEKHRANRRAVEQRYQACLKGCL